VRTSLKLYAVSQLAGSFSFLPLVVAWTSFTHC
jgi:hypothetical protein